MRPHRSSNKGLIALILALGLTGCARDSGIIAPGDVPFSPPDVANSIHSLRFAADNIALVTKLEVRSRSLDIHGVLKSLNTFVLLEARCSVRECLVARHNILNDRRTQSHR